MQPKGTTLDVRRATLTSSSPLLVGALGLLLHQPLGAMTLIDDAEGEIGIAQASPQQGGRAWDVRFLAPSIAHSTEAARIWQRLLTALGVLACEHGAERLLAYVPEDAYIEQVFGEAGFDASSREQVFVLTNPPPPAPEPTGLRQLTGKDHAELRALVRATVPTRLTEMGEATPTRQRAPKGLFVSPPKEYVWVRNGGAAAYIGLFAGPQCYWLETLVRPELRTEVAPHLRFVLSSIECSPQLPVFCSVPDYAGGTGWILRALGFKQYVRQALMVSRLVSRVPVRTPVVFAGLEGSMDTSAPIRTCAEMTSTHESYEKGCS
ncbi:MAG: hypothetical protein ACP5G7_08475 [Anaerolineae bacterium]